MQYDSLGETMRQKQTLCFREVYHFLEAHPQFGGLGDQPWC